MQHYGSLVLHRRTRAFAERYLFTLCSKEAIEVIQRIVICDILLGNYRVENASALVGFSLTASVEGPGRHFAHATTPRPPLFTPNSHETPFGKLSLRPIFYPHTDHLCADSHNCCNHSSTLFYLFAHFRLSTAPKTLIP